MLIKHEIKQKFEIKWYDTYKILNHRFLKTYRLISSNERKLKNLFNNNRFVKANVINNNVKIWFLSVKQAKLRKQNKIVEPFISKVQKILDNGEFLSSIYDKLITMTKSEGFEIEQTKKSKVKNGSNERKILIKKKDKYVINLNIHQSKNESQKKRHTKIYKKNKTKIRNKDSKN